MASFDLQALAGMFAARMVNSVIEGVAVALLAWVLLALLGRRNASTRFVVWLCALLVIGVLPWLDGIAVGHSAGAARAAITLPGSWAMCALVLWSVLAGLGMVGVSLSLWRVRTLRRACSPINVQDLDPVLQRTLLRFSATRSVSLAVSDDLHVPTALGFFLPMIVMPAWAMRELSTAELHSILIHELAHLRRRDDWTNLAQKIVRALLFFHPAVWWLEHKLSLEREMACDDEVLAQTENARAYAACLVSLAEKSFLRRGLALAQAAVHRMRQTSLRVTRILHGNSSPATGLYRPALYVAAAFSVLCVISVSRAPELVAFESSAPTAIASTATPRLTPGVSLVGASASSAPFAEQAKAVQLNYHPAAYRPTHDHPATQSSRFAGAGKTAKNINPMATPADGPDTPAPDNNELAQVELSTGNLVQAAMFTTEMLTTEQIGEHTVLVVMQSDQYRASGRIWTITVWRVTLVDPASAAKATNPAKQI